MRRYLLPSLALATCCAFAIGGYAVGAYMQFLQTFAATQDTFARDIITAQGLTKNESSGLLEWMRTDIPLQYQYLVMFEATRNSSLPVSLSSVARMTWSQRSMASYALRSSDQWRQMMQKCACGLASTDPSTK